MIFQSPPMLRQIIAQTPIRVAMRIMANLLLPHQCVICRCFADSTGLCASCWQGLQIISNPFCIECGRPLPHALPESKCGSCWVAPPPLKAIRAMCLYGDVSRSLILKFKHGDGPQLVPIFAQLMQRGFNDLWSPEHLVVPIPLHRRRYLYRRYNQSAELARYLCHKHPHGHFAPEILERIRHTRSQGGLNREQRRRDLKGSFQVPTVQHDQLAGRPVLLVDDVITTGATIFEAAQCLTKAGSGPVSALAIARVS